MIALVLLLAVVLAIAGTAITSVLAAEARRAIAGAAPRRLRGAWDLPPWLGRVGAYLSGSAAATALGTILLGAALPALLGDLGLLAFAIVVVVAGIPAILAVAYIVPRGLVRLGLLRSVRPVLPLVHPWTSLLRPVLPEGPGLDPESLLRRVTGGATPADPELAMAGGVMTFSARPVREVMTPRTEIVALPAEASRDEAIEAFVTSGYSRLPLYRGTRDEIVGMVHVFDLLAEPSERALPVRPVAVTPASRSCGDLLLEMQREGRHLALVLDEFGGTQGIATLEDLLESLVGEIYDELDPPAPTPTAVGVHPAPLEADASTPVSQVTDWFGVTLPAGAATTIAGLLAELAGRIPETGERFQLRGLDFDVLHASPARAERILVRVAGRATTLYRESP